MQNLEFCGRRGEKQPKQLWIKLYGEERFYTASRCGVSWVEGANKIDLWGGRGVISEHISWVQSKGMIETWYRLIGGGVPLAY